MAKSISVSSIAKGGVIFSAGNLSAKLIQLVGGIIVIRILTKNEYGLITLSYTFINILALIGLLGMRTGIPRLITKARLSSSGSHLGELVGSSLFMVMCTGIIVTSVLFWFSDAISTYYKKPELEATIKFLAFLVFPLIVIRNTTAIYRGFKKIWPKVFFQDVGLAASRLILVLFCALFSLGFDGVLAAYVGAGWIVLLLYLVYSYRDLFKKYKPSITSGTIKEISSFSFPLLGSEIFPRMMIWSGLLLLGYFATTEEVALYSAPQHLIRILPVVMVAMLYLYLPVSTKLFSQGRHEELSRLYKVIAKWSLLFTYPLAVYILLDAEFIVINIFGEGYGNSANILRMFAVAYTVRCAVGPSTSTLVSCGHSKSVLYSSVITLVISVWMSLALIPKYGAFGAGLSMATGVALIHMIGAFVLYYKQHIHAASVELIMSVILVSLAGLLAYIVNESLQIEYALYHISLLIVLIIISIASPVIMRNLADEDVDLIKAVELRVRKKTEFTDYLRAIAGKNRHGASAQK